MQDIVAFKFSDLCLFSKFPVAFFKKQDYNIKKGTGDVHAPL